MKVSHFKTTISAQIRRVQEGESIIITDHNRAVALVSPVSQPLIERAASRAFSVVPVVLEEGFSGSAEDLLQAERGNR